MFGKETLNPNVAANTAIYPSGGDSHHLFAEQQARADKLWQPQKKKKEKAQGPRAYLGWGAPPLLGAGEVER